MIARLALRIAAIEALRGNTKVGDNVLDSQITALDTDADGTLISDQEKSFISVYAGESMIEGGTEARSLHKSGPTQFVIESAYAATMTATDPDTDESVVLPGIPATDGAFEFFLDIVDRQVINTLTDTRNEWAEIWRGLMSRIVKIERKRAADATGVRLAAHQTIITVDLLPDPVFGDPIAPTSIWAKFFAKLAGTTVPNPDYDPDDENSPEVIVAPRIAAILAELLPLVGDVDGILAHEAQRRRYGLTIDEARALMDMPPPAAEATEPVFTEIMHEQVP